MKLLLHIPHTSLILPVVFHQGLCLSEDELNVVLEKHTDRFTDVLFARRDIPCVIASYSRLYCDVERFLDDSVEPMSRF